MELLLLAVLIVLSGVITSRADALITDDIHAISAGGRITFQTNGIFSVTNTIVIRTNTQIDGGDLDITISGINFWRIFYVTNNVELTLTNIHLIGGKNSQGAAIYNNYGTVIASNIVFNGNNATNKTGANGVNGGGGSIDGGAGAPGVAGYGGAIYNNHGTLLMTNCVFTNNVALGGNGGKGGNGYNSLGGNGGAGGNGGVAYGGAIYNNGTNYLLGCYFVANTAFAGSGGAGGSGGTGPVPGDTGAGGVGAVSAGAGVYNGVGGRVYVTNCSFVANRSFGGDTAPQGITYNGLSAHGQNGGTAFGGGIHNAGILNVENSTFFTNMCRGGAGGNTLGDPTASAGTGGNGCGGAIANGGTFFALNCTLVTNSVFGGAMGTSPYATKNGSAGSALGANVYRSAGTSRIQNCLLQHGAGADNSGALTDGGYNLSSDTSCAFLASSTSISKTNAQMAELVVFFPGVVPPLLPFRSVSPPSPAQDRIPPIPADYPTNFPVTDERGLPRGTNGLADIGAYEFQATAPSIIGQPKDQAVLLHSNATFTVSAIGASPLVYQWTFISTNGTTNFPASTNNSTLTITNVQATNLGTYFVVVTNALGSATSSNAVLSFVEAPVLLSQTPASITADSGSTVIMSITAKGNPLTYRWYFFTNVSQSVLLSDGADISGSDTASLTLDDVTRPDQGSYKVVISNALGTATANFTLTVKDPGIVTQPQDVTTNYGSRAIFSVEISSITNVINYQWRHAANNAAVLGSVSSPSYTNQSAIANDAYYVVVSNAFGVVTSQVAHLTINNPGISSQPTSLVRTVGTSATFAVTASGSPVPTYQWFFNNSSIAGATKASYTNSSVSVSDAGSYFVVVSNSVGTITSSTATLTVQGSSSISGQILFGTNGVSGVTVSDGVTNTVSAANGSYSFTQLASGSYTITPMQIGSGLLPVSTNVVVGTGSVNNVNFTFNGPILQITSVPTNGVVPLHVLSAPGQQLLLLSSTDLNSWSNYATFTPDTNGTWDLSVTNTSADSTLFLRAVAP